MSIFDLPSGFHYNWERLAKKYKHGKVKGINGFFIFAVMACHLTSSIHTYSYPIIYIKLCVIVYMPRYTRIYIYI